MKKSLKIGVMSLATLMVFGLTGCGKAEKPVYTNSYIGDYHYDYQGTTYGIKLAVSIEDNKIVAISVFSDKDSGYTSVSNAMGNWKEEDVNNWKNNEKNYYGQFIGKTVEEVKAMTATVSGYNGKVSGADVVSGSTLSSARALSALKAAIANYESLNK